MEFHEFRATHKVYNVEYFKGLASFEEGQRKMIGKNFNFHIKPITTANAKLYKSLMVKMFTGMGGRGADQRKVMINNFVEKPIDRSKPDVKVEEIFSQSLVSYSVSTL